MKIICVDNFGRDFVSDQLIAENVNPYVGAKMVTLLNKAEGSNSPNFYRCVDDDYKLRKFEP